MPRRVKGSLARLASVVRNADPVDLDHLEDELLEKASSLLEEPTIFKSPNWYTVYRSQEKRKLRASKKNFFIKN